MLWVAPVVAVAFVVGIFIASLLWKREVKIETSSVKPQRYGRTDSIMSESERAVYPLLQWAVGKELQVHPKVSLSAIITVPQNIDRRFVHVRQVSSHQVDFALCVVGRASAVVVVMISNPKDEDSGRFESDQFISEALTMARVPVIWLHPKKSYMAHELKQLIQAATHAPVVTREEDDTAGVGKKKEQ